MPKTPKTQINMIAAWQWRRTRNAKHPSTWGLTPAQILARRRKKLAEGYEGAKELAERLNFNVMHDIETERRIEPPMTEPLVEDLSPERKARINRKLREGLEVGREMAARLNFNLLNDVDSD